MPKIHVNNTELHYEEFGDKNNESIILIGGLGSDIASWTSQIPTFSQDYHVVVFDNRAAGQSALSQVPFTTKDMARDTVELMRHLNVARAHIVGHSMGGAIAQQVALNFPEYVKTLTLSSTFTKVPNITRLFLDTAISLRNEGVSTESWVKMQLPWVYHWRFLENPQNVKHMVDAALNKTHPQLKEGYEQQVAACLQHDSLEQLAQLHTLPMLLLVGEDDKVTPVDGMQAIADACPHADFHIIANTAHGCKLEDPKTFNNHLKQFWKQHAHA